MLQLTGLFAHRRGDRRMGMANADTDVHGEQVDAVLCSKRT